MIPTTVVIDARSVVDLLLNGTRALPVMEATIGRLLAAPVHIDSEVMSMLAWIQRLGPPGLDISPRVDLLCELPLQRHPLGALLRGAWARRAQMAVEDALYVELAERLDAVLVTGDRGMAGACAKSILIE